MADQFFDRSTTEGTGPASGQAEVTTLAAENGKPESGPIKAKAPFGMLFLGLPPIFWVGAAIFLFIFVMMFASYV